MQFRTGAMVKTQDGRTVGQVDRVVIDPRSNEVTHLVVRKGAFFRSDKVVAMAAVDSAEEDRVLLRPDVRNLDGETDFEERLYVPLDAGQGVTGHAGIALPAAAGAGFVGQSVYNLRWARWASDPARPRRPPYHNPTS